MILLKWKLKIKRKLTPDERGMLAAYNKPVDFTRKKNIHEPDRPSINLKYSKDGIYELRSAFKEIQPGYHMNKDNWNTVYLDGSLKDEFIRELIDISYELIFNSLTKQKRKELLGD